MPLKIWSGRGENVPAAQAALLHRARCNSAAVLGEYSPEMEDQRPIESAEEPAHFSSGLTIDPGYRAQAGEGTPFPRESEEAPGLLPALSR